MENTAALPLPTLAGQTRAITCTPVVGTPKREFAGRSPATAPGLSIKRATMALKPAHTSCVTGVRVIGPVKPDMAGLSQTPMLSHDVAPMIFQDIRKRYDGATVRTQHLTVLNVTKAAIVSQAKLQDSLPFTPGVQAQTPTPTAIHGPEWWGKELHALD